MNSLFLITIAILAFGSVQSYVHHQQPIDCDDNDENNDMKQTLGQPISILSSAVIPSPVTASPALPPTTAPKRGLKLIMRVDDKYMLYLNGMAIGTGTSWTQQNEYTIQVSRNDVLAVTAEDHGGLFGIQIAMTWVGEAAPVQQTGARWFCSTSAPNTIDWMTVVTQPVGFNPAVKVDDKWTKPVTTTTPEFFWAKDPKPVPANAVWCRFVIIT